MKFKNYKLYSLDDKNIAYIEFFYNDENYSIEAEYSYNISNDIFSFFYNEKICCGDNEYTFDNFKDKKIIQNVANNLLDLINKENDFINYHFTGSIKDDFYSEKKFDFFKVENYPFLIDKVFIEKLNDLVEFRQSGEKLIYVKKNEDGEIMRDPHGMAIMMNESEMDDRNLLKNDPTILVFYQDQCVGLASDEFGSDGVWIKKDFQKMGIGTILLLKFRQQFSESRKMGQMTSLGKKLARSYFRKFLK